MKKKITTLIMAISLMGGSLSAQTQSGGDCVPKDSKLLSTCTQGEYTVNRYLVKERSSDNDEFSVRYQVNLSRLISTYDNNAAELKGLHSFVEELQSDTLRRITSVNVTGFASPDGPAALNERLSMSRAVDFRQYIDKNFGMSKYKGTTKADALSWGDTYDAVSSSSMPNKSAVLTLVRSSLSAADIEAKLKTMPDSWSYMRSYILPSMRYVELCVKYNSWKVVETRTLVKSCQSESKPTENTYLFIVLQEPRGMIVNPSCSKLDYEEEGFKEVFKLKRHGKKFKDKKRIRGGQKRRRIYIRRG